MPFQVSYLSKIVIRTHLFIHKLIFREKKFLRIKLFSISKTVFTFIHVLEVNTVTEDQVSRPDSLDSTAYPVIGDPPLSRGGDHTIVAESASTVVNLIGPCETPGTSV